MSSIVGGSILAVITGFMLGTALVGFVLASGGYGSPTVITRAAGPLITVAPPLGAQSGQKAAPAAAASVVNVVATDLKFAPNALTARTGEPIKVVLENKGLIEHDIAFPTLKADKPADQLKALAKPGQTASLELTPSEGTLTVR
jgi:uncharacterized cupredoxin-like copper-binding protein